jgi:ribokinase
MTASIPTSGPIVVIGSLNMDLVMRTARIPNAGETLSGHGFDTLPGGKGANQAVACARLGGQVAMIGRVGIDAFGRALRDALAADGIDVERVEDTGEAATGVAMILVEDIGENRIVLAPGANGRLDAADIERSRTLIEEAALLVLQLEVPLDTVCAAIAIARQAGVPILLNPAPASALPDALYSSVDLLVPNESEATLLTGIKVRDPASAEEAARSLLARGVRGVLITLGAQGVLIADADGCRHLPARVVQAVDSTAAGDTFVGGLAVGLTEGLSLDEAAALGQAASAICVTRAGAQPSIPRRSELTQWSPK